MAGEFQSFLDNLRTGLGKLAIDRQLAFGASCCERHFPEYVVFVEEQGWGDSAILRITLERAWKIARGEQAETTGLSKRCENAIPDSEDFSSDATSPALSAAAMVTHLANFLETPRSDDIWWIASLGRDVADFRSAMEYWPAYTLLTPEIEVSMETSEFMKTELEAQRTFLELASARALDLDKLFLQARGTGDV
jgi:uncharacterized protein